MQQQPSETIVPQAARVPVRLKLAFGLGAVAYGIKDNGFSSFLLIFYNQVLGLDAGLVGAIIMTALMIDAFIDPAIGILSDRTDTRWGRRLPWLYGSAIPLGILWLLIWDPPQLATHTEMAVWLFVLAVAVRTAVSCNELPSMAIGPELTSDYHERSLLTRYRFILGWLAGLIMLMLAFAVFLKPVVGPGARPGYAVFGLVGGAVMAISIIGSAVGLHRRLAHRSPHRVVHATLRDAIADMKRAYADPGFAWLMLAALFVLANQGMIFAITNYLLDYVWQLSPVAKQLYALSLFAGVATAFLLIAPLGKRFDKRRIAAVGSVLAAIIGTLPYDLRYLGLYPDAQSPLYLALLLGPIAIATVFGVIVTMVTPSMLADMVEVGQAASGKRQEGMYSAGFMFTQKGATGVGIFCSGLMLRYARFPTHAEIGAVPADVIGRLCLAIIVVSIGFALLAAWSYWRFPFGRAEHEERLRRLAVASAATPS